ncbi:hypothetical protein LP420_32870 [Massilia sp. B-10]|nr:hypothetical protein LP420_32870 [Massilia sp. B-10]
MLTTIFIFMLAIIIGIIACMGMPFIIPGMDMGMGMDIGMGIVDCIVM